MPKAKPRGPFTVTDHSRLPQLAGNSQVLGVSATDLVALAASLDILHVERVTAVRDCGRVREGSREEAPLLPGEAAESHAVRCRRSASRNETVRQQNRAGASRNETVCHQNRARRQSQRDGAPAEPRRRQRQSQRGARSDEWARRARQRCLTVTGRQKI